MQGEPRFLVIGFGSEVVTAHFVKYLSSQTVPYLYFDLDAEVADEKWHLSLKRDGVIWSNSNGDSLLRYDLPIYHRFFIRPEKDPAAAFRLQEAFDVFTAHCNAAPSSALIINRLMSGTMNWAKLTHMRTLRRLGFEVPFAITSNKRDELQKISMPAINKGCSGTRSIAEQTGEAAIQSLADELVVPAMLQRYVAGPDIRVHFIGHEHSAIMFKTQYDDYRYASRHGWELEFRPTTVHPDLVDRCYRYMKSERLEFAGFDFKIDSDGAWWLLEVNPMPGFAFFDKRCNFQISELLYKKLCTGYGTFLPIEGRPNIFISSDRIPDVDRGKNS